jgi:hypothetical protein
MDFTGFYWILLDFICKNNPVTINRIETWNEVDSTDSKFAMTGLCANTKNARPVIQSQIILVFNKFHPHFITNMKKMWSIPLLEAYSHCIYWVASNEKGSQI